MDNTLGADPSFTRKSLSPSLRMSLENVAPLDDGLCMNPEALHHSTLEMNQPPLPPPPAPNHAPPPGMSVRPGGLSPLSHTLWKSTLQKASPIVGDLSAWLTWKDLDVFAINGRGEKRPILSGITGYAEPGHMMAIMGPSGSGKSMLLDTLAGTHTSSCP